MKRLDFYQQITGIIEIYHDNPARWISENEELLLTLAHKFRGSVVLESLEVCVSAGNLSFFFDDFPKWKRIADAARPESPEQYFRRTGLICSMAKPGKSIKDERAARSETEMAEVTECFRTLKRRFPGGVA
jgi:hypothetical protein